MPNLKCMENWKWDTARRKWEQTIRIVCSQILVAFLYRIWMKNFGRDFLQFWKRVLFKIFLLYFPLFDAVRTYFQFSKHIKRNVLWRKIFERFIVTFLFAFYLKVIELGLFLSEIWFWWRIMSRTCSKNE